jgi:hypothetical protein
MQEAGRHPDEELRQALGRFGARMLVEELDRITAFEIADALNRMTSLDYDYLKHVHECEESGRAVGTAWGPEEDSASEVELGFLGGPGGITKEAVLGRLRRDYPGLDEARLESVERRLLGLGLLIAEEGKGADAYESIAADCFSWRHLTPVGARLLELACPVDGTAPAAGEDEPDNS